MLYLLFQIGDDHYALDADQIDTVLPLVRCKKIPAAPIWVEGVFSHQGHAVPVLDISLLATGKPALRRLSTRVVLVRFRATGQPERLLGLLVEHATNTLRCDPEEFVDTDIAQGDARYLGAVKHHQNRLIQRIDIHQLLDASVQALLFAETETP